MNIQDAIKEAGPNGKGYNTERGIDFTIDGNGFVTWPQRSPNIADFDSTDWQVVAEERIEVGDIVKIELGKWAGLKMEVFWADNNSTGVLLKLGLDMPHREEIANLTLIRKGPAKHVLEHIQWKKMEVEPDAFGYTTARVPVSSKPEQGLGDLCDNGKTYRMTLEEME